MSLLGRVEVMLLLCNSHITCNNQDNIFLQVLAQLVWIILNLILILLIMSCLTIISEFGEQQMKLSMMTHIKYSEHHPCF